MKKRITNLASLLVVLMIIVSACSEKHDYTNIIPVDASSVVAINLKSMGDNAGLNSTESQDFKLRIIDALKSGLSASALLHVEKILKEPAESGVSLDDPIYIFSSPSFPYPAVAGKVSDAKKLRNTLNIMAAEQISEPVTEAKGYDYAIIGNGIALVYNKDAFLISLRGNWLQQDATARLLRYENDSTIQQNPYYQQMISRKGNIVFFASPGKFSFGNMFRQMGTLVPYSQHFSDMMFIGNMNFEKGKIAVQVEFHTEDEELKAMMDKLDQATGKINGKLLGGFPVSSPVFFSSNINNGEEIYKLLSEYQIFRREFSLEQSTRVRELFHSFKGDISVALINAGLDGMPTFVALAETEKGEALDAIYEQKSALKLGRGQDIIKLAPNEYVFKSGKMNLFYGVKDNNLYATNDELIYKGLGAANDQSLKDARYASAIKGKKQYFVLDVEAVTQLPIVKMMTGFLNKENLALYRIVTNFSYLEAFSEETEKGELNLYFRDKDTNSLKQIIDIARQYTGM